MKTLLRSTSLLALILGTPAIAADVYSGGSTKDAPGEVYAASTGRGGFYISGTLGYAWRDTEYSRTIQREVGADVKIPKDAKQEEIDELAKELTDEGIAHRGNLVPGGNLILPLAGDILNLSDEDDNNGFVFGAGVQYLRHTGGQFGLSIGADIEFYGEGESKFSHTDVAGKISSGNLIGDFGCGGTGCAGEVSPFPQSGVASVDREFDVDLVLLAHWFVNDRFALHAGGGVSFARADICGANFSGATSPILTKAFDTKFCDDDTAIGPMVKVGFDWWMTDRMRLGVDVTGKWHDFSASGDAYNSVELGRDISIYGQSHDTIEADDVVWAAKGRLSIKLN
jgi:hypothetical protein